MAKLASVVLLDGGSVVKAIVERAPAEISIALEQVVLVPSEAPIRITFVFKTLTLANVATPLTADTGLAVALNPPETALVHELSE